MSNIITCEQVSSGHPDKICDQIADAIVTDCLRHDKNSRVAIEVLIKDNHLVIAGELTSGHGPDFRKLVDEVFDRIGKERLGYPVDNLDIQIFVSRQSPDIAMGVDAGGAGDQGMMFGYATNETPELLPVPFVLATRLLEKLKEEKGIFRADAKAQVSFDYDDWKIKTFLCSAQTAEGVSQKDLKARVGKLMKEAASESALNRNFKILVNPTGKFEVGGPYADSGVTGRKLACDTYGGVGHIGGGAMSGKDPSKVVEGVPPVKAPVVAGNLLTRHYLENYVDKYVLVGCVPDQAHWDWIFSRKGKYKRDDIYNVRLGDRPGAVKKSNAKVRSPKFVVMYDKDNPLLYKVYRIRNHAVITKDRIMQSGYPNPHGDYFCYILDEQVSLGVIDVPKLLSENTVDLEHPYKPIYLTAQKVREYVS